jgi:OsmC-like protein
MDRDELRTAQAPLKERYESEPEAALVTLATSGTLGEGISCSVDTGRALAAAGLHPASGATAPCSARATCCWRRWQPAPASPSRRFPPPSASRSRPRRSAPKGDLDFRGTLAVDRDAPVGFRAIRLAFELESDASEEELATLLKLTERYCVVLQTLASPPELSASLKPASV